jgi:DNA phosphorothioation-associated putative methyltransferase
LAIGSAGEHTILTNIESQKTAISRGGRLSKPLQLLTESGKLTSAMGLFDWGHGRGEDMIALKKAGWARVSGWDPHWYIQNYSIEDEPAKLSYNDAVKIEWVYCGYVLNVIPDSGERTQVLQDIFRFLQPGRQLCIAVRAKKEVDASRSQLWKIYNDGWLTSRGTFQKGFGPNELISLLIHCGFENIDVLSTNPLVVTSRKPDTIEIYGNTLYNQYYIQYMNEVTHGWEDAFYDSFQG